MMWRESASKAGVLGENAKARARATEEGRERGAYSLRSEREDCG